MSELSMDIGSELRDARQALCLDIAALSAELCITKRQLLALEENRTEDLPGPTYAIGFLRVYADRLRLDADALCHAYRLKYGDADLTPKLHFPEPLPESRIPALSVVISGSLALAGIYMGWSALSGGQTMESNLVPAPSARLVAMVQGESDDSGDSSTKQEIEPAIDENSTRSDAAEQPAPVYQLAAAKEATAEPVASESEARIEEVIEPPVQQSRSQVVKSAVASVPPPSAIYKGGRSRIQILALQDTWIMITDKDERLLMEGVIRTGERYAPPAIPGLRLTTSNAGGLELTMDGQTMAPLGKKGAVVRSVVLDPKRMSAGGAL